MSNVKTFGPSTVNEFRLSFLRVSTTTDQPQGGFAKLIGAGICNRRRIIGHHSFRPAGIPGDGAAAFSFNNFSIGVPTLTTTPAEQHVACVGCIVEDLGTPHREVRGRVPLSPDQREKRLCAER